LNALAFCAAEVILFLESSEGLVVTVLVSRIVVFESSEKGLLVATLFLGE
jgi:hypothetical protein